LPEAYYEAYYIIDSMFSLLWRAMSEARFYLSRLRRLGLRAFLALTALQATIVGVLVAMAEYRKRRQGPRQGFPWEEQPEIKLESGEDRLKIYAYGVSLYEAMLEEIEAARDEIFVGTFIWKGDEVGRRFVGALARKAGEGVEVYVVFDGLANVLVPPSFKKFPERIHCLHFRPLSGPAKILNPRNVFRFHRHVMSVDGKVAFLGGYNIGSLYAAGWRDTHVRVRGEAAREVDNAFVDFWNAHRTGELPEIIPNKERDWNPAVRVRRNDPYMRIFPIREMYIEAIDRANSHVYLTHAYFVPDRALKAHLIEATRRGVDVQVLVPEQSNHVTADWLARRHFYDLLKNGVRIFLYRHIMIHSKTATVDGLWSTIGSANIDRLSMLGNYELNIEVYSRKLAAQMERMFETDKTNAEELTLEEWERRPLPAKLVERTLASLSPLV
jgi:cardiolipin synthase